MKGDKNDIKTAQQGGEKKVVFENCKTYGDEIDALVRHYTGDPANGFVLERALEIVRLNNKELNAYKQELIEKSIGDAK